MQTVNDIIDLRKQSRRKPDEQELRRLPYKDAYIYGRVSSPGQVRDSRESILEIARLLELAIKDGYRTSLDPEDIKAKLELIRYDPSAEKLWSDEEVTVDVRDLGISGQLSDEDRLGLAELQRRVEQGKAGAIYLTEGVSRLSRDRDRIVPYRLLKLLKEHSVRIRTLDGIWNPVIDRDHDYLADEFEEAIGERKVMGRRMYRRKAQKAARGEFVGEPIPLGFILPITGQKPTGEYEYGKMEPYPPHKEVVNQILEEFVRQNGGYGKTLRALDSLTIPCFPPELNYMERLTALRTMSRTGSGYRITFSLIRGLATNPKLIGVWQWGNTEPIMNNHEPVVPEELFLEAYQFAARKGKPKGKASNFEPMEWSGLLCCHNHSEPRNISSFNSKSRYICNRGYFQEGESVCLDITGRFLDEPLTTAVIEQLDLTPFTEEMLIRLESDSNNRSLEEVRNKQQATRLEVEIKKYQALLPSCVDDQTGQVDREREEYYWRQIKELEQRLKEIKSRPVPVDNQPVDYFKIKEFLKGISKKWYTYSSRLRNRLLNLIIERVEITGTYDIEATIFWKNGFQQKVLIHRPPSTSKLDVRWTQEEDKVLRRMYQLSSVEALMTALSNRSWKGITLRAWRLKLSRNKGPNKWETWSKDDDNQLTIYHNKGMKIGEIAEELGRSTSAITSRIQAKGLSKSPSNREKTVSYEISDLIPSQQRSSRGGLRG